MTDNEKLYFWQYNVLVAPWLLKSAPDYPNDDAACGSLLDTLVEKGYLFTLKYTGENRYRWWFEIGDAEEVIVAVKYNRATLREAIVAACLEVARKEVNNG